MFPEFKNIAKKNNMYGKPVYKILLNSSVQPIISVELLSSVPSDDIFKIAL